MKFFTKNRNVLFALLISALSLLCINSLITKTAAASAQEAINATLERLDASDAFFADTIELDDGNHLVYHSNSTNCDYRFLESTGVLTSVTNLRGETNSSTTYMAPLSNTKRQKLVLDYASELLQDALIGQLEIVEEHDAGYAYYYTIKEYHEEAETGTNAFVICYADGWISVCNLSYGKIFTQNKTGTVFLNNDDPMIGEEAAIELVLNFVEEHAAGKGNTLLPETATISTVTYDGEQCYEIYVDTIEPSGYVIDYVILVEVHSGEILMWCFSQ